MYVKAQQQQQTRCPLSSFTTGSPDDAPLVPLEKLTIMGENMKICIRWMGVLLYSSRSSSRERIRGVETPNAFCSWCLSQDSSIRAGD